MVNNNTYNSNNNIIELELTDNLGLKLLDDKVKLSLTSSLKKSKAIEESKTNGIGRGKDKGRQPYTSLTDDLCGPCGHEKIYHINKESCSQCECKEFDP